ncbi:MAG: SoxR reducing system RseC family protein [Bacteroidota bacterium]|nr:SoxR reducing system RseC family protein [Bacteroidota bacterium]
MSTNDCIEHEGIIQEITPKKLLVSIVSNPACSSCNAKSACASAESVEKTIEVSPYLGTYNIGDKVVVKLNQSLGVRAILLGYVYPFVILFATLIVGVKLTGKELTAGIASLLLVAIYFFSLKLFHVQLEKTFHFDVEKV